MEIDLARVEGNLAELHRVLGAGPLLCAVLKADAYGAGIANVAPVLIRGGVNFAAVASTAEAAALRRAGYHGRVLRIRTASPQEASAALGLGVEELVGTPEVARRLSSLACGAGIELPVHLAINAGGMSRDGLELATPDGPSQARAMLGLPGLRVVGIMTHFPEDAPDAVRACLHTFRREAEWLLEEGGLTRRDVLLHAANSMATLSLPETHLDMVRCGAALYGCVGAEPAFRPIQRLCSAVASVVSFPKGNTVGYDRSVRLTRPSRLANIPLGYSNGYRRSFSPGGQVLIRGHRAPVMGKVSMNSVMVDVTEIPEAQAGDEAVFFGCQEGACITRDEVQRQTGLVLADLFCTWGAENERVIRID
ncbi:alanine racemase [Celeribacter sp. SCSIO 80788]|uniref:alanine racemase n=1 Tax=Celeribacter sp. SCSIO 80788 TaxID=3117013 RepID=UPI003DA2BB63